VQRKDSRGPNADPLVPMIRPAIVVDEHIVPLDISYLCLQPLLHGILDINPLTNIEFSANEVEPIGALRLSRLEEPINCLEVLPNRLSTFRRI
jgi:hypothetical protein